MAQFIEVACPCCHSTLLIDPETHSVIRHEEQKKKPLIEDLAAAARSLKGESARLNEAFEKSFASHLTSGKVLDKKFDELLKQAKEDKSEPPKRAFDFD